jgi:hypothetical protein
MTGERIFQGLTVALACVAVYFLWRGNSDAVFAAAVLGACCFFISVRFQVRDRIRKRSADAPAADDDMPENGSASKT